MNHEETTRRCYEALSAGDVDTFAEMVADDFVEHEETPGFEPTREGVVQFFKSYLEAFPDLRMDPEDIITDDDKAVARLRVTGTQRGEFMGIPASGKGIDVNVIDIFRFDDDGRVSEHWGVSDTMAMMQQLGLVPEDGPA